MSSSTKVGGPLILGAFPERECVDGQTSMLYTRVLASTWPKTASREVRGGDEGVQEERQMVP